jgi:hypothetical protein
MIMLHALYARARLDINKQVYDDPSRFQHKTCRAILERSRHGGRRAGVRPGGLFSVEVGQGSSGCVPELAW